MKYPISWKPDQTSQPELVATTPRKPAALGPIHFVCKDKAVAQ